MYRNDALVFESCMHKNIKVYLAFNCLKMCNVDKGLSKLSQKHKTNFATIFARKPFSHSKIEQNFKHN